MSWLQAWLVFNAAVVVWRVFVGFAVSNKGELSSECPVPLQR